MTNSFTITVTDPMALVYHDKFEAYVKFTAALNEMMESIFKIIGPKYLSIHIFYDDSSHLYTDLGNPIKYLCEIGTFTKGIYCTEKVLRTLLYMNRETNKAFGVVHKKELYGSLDIVVKFLAGAILKWVQNKEEQ